MIHESVTITVLPPSAVCAGEGEREGERERGREIHKEHLREVPMYLTQTCQCL